MPRDTKQQVGGPCLQPAHYDMAVAVDETGPYCFAFQIEDFCRIPLERHDLGQWTPLQDDADLYCNTLDPWKRIVHGENW